uniref:Uncharacterized protein n=1 Tax=Arundo donax TaxID=35708 RepID=A0A0A9B6T5_ARUDO
MTVSDKSKFFLSVILQDTSIGS